MNFIEDKLHISTSIEKTNGVKYQLTAKYNIYLYQKLYLYIFSKQIHVSNTCMLYSFTDTFIASKPMLPSNSMCYRSEMIAATRLPADCYSA